MTIAPGGYDSYSVELSALPENAPDENGNVKDVDVWWVTLVVDCTGYANGYCGKSRDDYEIRWTPSRGRTFDGDSWNSGKDIRIEVGPAVTRGTYTFRHHVWDDDANCPVEFVAPVIVNIDGGTDTGGTSTGGTSTGGTSTGGTDTGGTSTGGMDTGGTDTGGTDTGGTDTGGTSTGGTSTGGTDTGGTDTGGANGGTDTGGTGTGGDGGGNGNGNGVKDDGGDRGGKDSLPTLAISDADVYEGETARFIVRLRPSSAGEVTVSYQTVSASARSGSDYRATSGRLRFAPGQTRRTIKVPTASDATKEPTEAFTVRLRNPAGATIVDGVGRGRIIGDAARQTERVNRTVLPEAGRALAFNTLECRIDRVSSNLDSVRETPPGRLPPSLGPTANRWFAEDRDRPLPDLVLRDWSFLVPSKVPEGGANHYATWGCGDFVSLQGGGEDDGPFAWDGEVGSVEFGFDVGLGSTALAGVSVSRSRAVFDYQDSGANGDAGGEYELGLTGIHPYFGWSASSDFDVWGTVGGARGDFDIADETAGEHMSSAATLYSGAIGAVGRLRMLEETKLKLKGELAFARLDLAGAGTEIRATAVDVRRLRMGTELEHERTLSSGGSLTSWGEVALRHDGGDGKTGAGLEFGSGVRYRNPDSGWTAEGYSRWLLLHEDTSRREIGFGAIVRLDPGVSGHGPSLSLTRTWGLAARGVRQPWEIGAPEPFPHDARTERLDLELAYGLSALAGRGVLTPFGAVSLDGSGGREYRLGGRFATGRSAIFSLEIERRERPVRDPAHSLLLRTAIRF